MSSRSPEIDVASLLADSRVRWTTDILRFSDTDANGHINNAAFAVFCESGRVGFLHDQFRAVLERLKPFGVHLHYTDRFRLPEDVERDLGLTFHESLEDMIGEIDVLTVHSPLTDETRGILNDDLLGRMRRGSYIVNPARGGIADRDAIVRALESGRLAGYAGDVWYPQPAPPEHPWRSMPHQGMTPHTSGTSLPSQARYAAGVREILEDFLAGRAIRDEYTIVAAGAYAGTGAKSYAKQG